jgi:hypothetical protein
LTSTLLALDDELLLLELEELEELDLEEELLLEDLSRRRFFFLLFFSFLSSSLFALFLFFLDFLLFFLFLCFFFFFLFLFFSSSWSFSFLLSDWEKNNKKIIKNDPTRKQCYGTRTVETVTFSRVEPKPKHVKKLVQEPES